MKKQWVFGVLSFLHLQLHAQFNKQSIWGGSEVYYNNRTQNQITYNSNPNLEVSSKIVTSGVSVLGVFFLNNNLCFTPEIGFAFDQHSNSKKELFFNTYTENTSSGTFINLGIKQFIPNSSVFTPFFDFTYGIKSMNGKITTNDYIKNTTKKEKTVLFNSTGTISAGVAWKFAPRFILSYKFGLIQFSNDLYNQYNPDGTLFTRRKTADFTSILSSNLNSGRLGLFYILKEK